jgi:hypothetical protein
MRSTNSTGACRLISRDAFGGGDSRERTATLHSASVIRANVGPGHVGGALLMRNVAGAPCRMRNVVRQAFVQLSFFISVLTAHMRRVVAQRSSSCFLARVLVLRGVGGAFSGSGDFDFIRAGDRARGRESGARKSWV